MVRTERDSLGDFSLPKKIETSRLTPRAIEVTVQGGQERDFKRQPILIVRSTEKNQEISNLPRLTGTEVRFDRDGNIYYPTWRERSHILQPDLYISRSRLPQNWTLERMLRVATRRPIVEEVYHQVRKDGGSVEAAIRGVRHILGKYRIENGEETTEIIGLGRQIRQAVEVVSQFHGRIDPEEFEGSFSMLHKKALNILNNLNMNQAVLQLKRRLADQIERGTRGRDRLGRPNPQVMLSILASAQAKAEARMETIRLIRVKFTVMDVALRDERRASREVLNGIVKEMGARGLAGHYVFKSPERGTSDRQRGILLGRLKMAINQLNLIKLNPYRPIAQEVQGALAKAQDLIRLGKYSEAREIFDQVKPKLIEVLEAHQRIYPKIQS